jgi:hypothetical protein
LSLSLAAPFIGKAYASDSANPALQPATVTQMQYCCGPNAPTTQTAYNYLNHGDARHPDQNCQVPQSGGRGSYHAGYPTTVMTGVWVDENARGDANVGAECRYIVPSQYCDWVATTSGVCPNNNGANTGTTYQGPPAPNY